MWISRLLARLRPAAPPRPLANSLTRAEVELITLVRLNPSTPLQGSDLALAQTLASRGLLKSAGARRFVVTERAVVAYRQPRG